MRLLLATVGLLLAGAAQAQTLQITGQVRHPAALSLDDLRGLARATVQWSTRNGCVSKASSTTAGHPNRSP